MEEEDGGRERKLERERRENDRVGGRFRGGDGGRVQGEEGGEGRGCSYAEGEPCLLIDHALFPVRCEGKSLAEKLALEQRLAGRDVEGGAGKEGLRVKAAQGGLASCGHTSRAAQWSMIALYGCCVSFVAAAVRHRLQSRASKTLLGLGRHLRQEVQRSEGRGVTLSMLQQALRAFHISVTPEVGGSQGGCGLLGVYLAPPLGAAGPEHFMANNGR